MRKSSVPNVLFIIPARLASTRLPRKLLLSLEDTQKDSTIIRMTYEGVLRSKLARRENTIIATPDEEIKKHAESFGAEVCMTTNLNPSGTDRVQEAASLLGAFSSGKQYDAIVNVQGDEPFIAANVVDAAVNGLLSNTWADVSTCAVAMTGPPDVDPSKVKVVCGRDGRALYFSRQPIPTNAKIWLKHYGIYAYRPNILTLFASLPRSTLEGTEDLEQLRLLELGYQYHVAIVEEEGFGGIDTPADFERAKEYFADMQKSNKNGAKKKTSRVDK